MATDNRTPQEAEFFNNFKTDEFGNKFFIDKQGRKLIHLGTVPSQEDAIECMLDAAVEAEMKRRHPDTYQNPDDKAGTA